MYVVNKTVYLSPAHPNYNTTTESRRISPCQSRIHKMPTEMSRLIEVREIEGCQK